MTFSAMKIKKFCTIKDRNLTLKEDGHIFARLLVICGKHNLLMKEILTYSLGPNQWSLATADGGFVKSVKSKLLDTIEKDFEKPMLEGLRVDCVRVFYGMVIIQQQASVNLATFVEMSEYVFKRITSHPGKSLIW